MQDKKTYKQCCSEVAIKYGLGKSLVTGHLPKYWEEASQLYVTQFYSKEEVVKLIDTALRTESLSFGFAMNQCCSITEYAERNYTEAFDEFIKHNLR